jgi:hypothetical protein
LLVPLDVPGVTLNRNFKEGDDNSAPIQGERANNAYVLIDGMPNRDGVDGGPAGQFNQDSILEFLVLTAGYKAEFSHGSGGIVNVVTKGGTIDWHGSASLYHRNYLLETPNVLNTSVPFLLRWDTSATIGGPIKRDKPFFFFDTEGLRLLIPQLFFVTLPSPQFEAATIANIENAIKVLRISRVTWCSVIQQIGPYVVLSTFPLTTCCHSWSRP